MLDANVFFLAGGLLMIIDKVSTFPPGLLVRAILGMEQVPLRHPTHGDGGRHPARSDGGRGQQLLLGRA